MSWWTEPVRPLDLAAESTAREHQAGLTKPPGSLGRLEEIAIRLASMFGSPCPTVDPAHILVFAGDHGVAAAGVSAYPQSVTGQMVANMARGGAAISVLAEELDARLELIVLGIVGQAPLDQLPSSVRLIGVGSCTKDLSQEPAMSPTQLDACLLAGREAVERAAAEGCRLIVGGEMGIGNSTAASAIACAILDRPASDLTGPGTGLDAAGVRRKTLVIEQALRRHGDAMHDPLETMRQVGGFEIAALAGAYLRAAQLGIPMLVDGFIATSAALAACRIQPDARGWLLFGHRSREPGHRILLEELRAAPLLDLNLHLGEGSGAAAALPLLRLACALHTRMASFAEAGVDGALS